MGLWTGASTPHWLPDLLWAWFNVDIILQAYGVSVDDAMGLLVRQFLVTAFLYWPLRWWFLTLRKLPSKRIPVDDKLSIGIFLVTGAPGFAAAAGPNAAADPSALAPGFMTASLMTVAVVVLGIKGPAWVQQRLTGSPP